MRPRVGDCSTSAARSNERPPPGRTSANQQHILRLIVTWLSVRAVQFAQSPWSALHTACRLRAGRPAWIVARTFTRPRSAMRRIVQSPTEGSTNESNHGRLVGTPATRLGGDVQPAAPAFQAAPAPASGVRPRVRGKFLFVGDEKLYVRGVTYGAFTPDAAGNEYHDLATVERDFAQMAANGINAVRIPHTTPPRALLDIASRHGLRVMVGLSAEQYVGYLIDRRPGAPDVEALI